jgi:hypothetical protein
MRCAPSLVLAAALYNKCGEAGFDSRRPNVEGPAGTVFFLFVLQVSKNKNGLICFEAIEMNANLSDRDPPNSCSIRTPLRSLASSSENSSAVVYGVPPFGLHISRGVGFDSRHPSRRLEGISSSSSQRFL